jgi:Zn finger protein HypA/HybF involved in hydrogenase expression
MNNQSENEVHLQCEKCLDFFEELESHSVIEHRDKGRFLREYYLCDDCSIKHLKADYYDVFDVENGRLCCPECGSDAIRLIPFQAEESENLFAGANFVCNGCSTVASLEYEEVADD